MKMTDDSRVGVWVVIYNYDDFSFGQRDNVWLWLFIQVGASQALGSGRTLRDAAARAIQGWHSRRLFGHGETGNPIVKVCGETLSFYHFFQLHYFSVLPSMLYFFTLSLSRRRTWVLCQRVTNSSKVLVWPLYYFNMFGNFTAIMSSLWNLVIDLGFLKRKKPSSVERNVQVAQFKVTKPQLGLLLPFVPQGFGWFDFWFKSLNCSIILDSLETMVVDVGAPADWVKINVQRFVSFSFESLFITKVLIFFP